MASGVDGRDPRYHVIFRNAGLAAPGEDYNSDPAIDLPLMLSTDGGQIGFTRGLVSPYGGRLSRGDLLNADLSQYTVRTQRGWGGGQGESDAFAQTERYSTLTGFDSRFGFLYGPMPAPADINAFSVGSSTAADNVSNVVSDGVTLWVARGRDVYNIDTGNPSQLMLRTTFAANVRSLAYFAGRVYASLDTGGDVNWIDATTYAIGTIAGLPAHYVAATPGYLNALTEAGVFRDYNGTTIGAAITIGQGKDTFNGLAYWQGQMFFASQSGLYSIAGTIPYLYRSWDRASFQAAIGKGLRAWVDNALYCPVQDNLLRFDISGAVSSAAIPVDSRYQLTESPDVVEMAAIGNWLIAITRTVNGSGVYARDLAGAWHTVYTLSGNHRIQGTGWRAGFIYFWVDGVPKRYPFALTVQDIKDVVTGNAQGTVEGSNWGGELGAIKKDVDALIVEIVDPVPNVALATITAAISADNGPWLSIGTVVAAGPFDAPRRFEIPIALPAFTPKTFATYTTAQQVFIVGVNESIADITVGQWMQIGADTVQILGKDDPSKTLRIMDPLSTTPIVGMAVSPARPAPARFRYRLTIDQGLLNAIYVRQVAMRYMDSMLNRYRWTLQIKVAEEMTDRMGGRFPISSAELTRRLEEYLRSPAPFIMLDPDGISRRVKAANANQTMFKSTPDGQSDYARLASTWQVSLIEA